MTEKRRPAYDLDAFKRAYAGRRVDVTSTALRDAAALGLGGTEMGVIIEGMRREHFYKSMTSYHDARLWQDVYHVPSEAGILYVKFTRRVLTEFVLLSFKEKDND